MTLKILSELIFLLVSILLISGLKLFSYPSKIQKATWLVRGGLLLVIASVFLDTKLKNFEWIFSALMIGSIFGVISSRKLKTDSYPQLQTFFWLVNSISSALLIFELFFNHPVMKYGVYGFVLYSILVSLFLVSTIIANSVILLLKFSTIIPDRPLVYPLKNSLNFLTLLVIIFLGSFIAYREDSSPNLLLFYFGLSLVLGILVFSTLSKELNQISFSFINLFSAANLFILGVLFENYLVLIISALLFAAGLQLFFQIQKYFNFSWKSLFIVDRISYSSLQNVQINLEDASIILENSLRILILPGVEFVNSKAYYACFELEDLLKKLGSEIKYCIHPLANQIFGHIDLVLFEGKVNYEDIIDFSNLNAEISSFDLVIVMGANNILAFDSEYNFQSSLEKIKHLLILTEKENEIIQIHNNQDYIKKVHILKGNIKTNLSKLISQIQKDLDL